MIRTAAWYVVDPSRLTGAAIARYPFRWLAVLHCHFNPRLDYGRPGSF